MGKASKVTRPTPRDQATSYRLGRVKSFGTKVEMLFRSQLHQLGVRYRVNVKNVIGCPDVVHAPTKTAIFIDGCFWHGHQGCYLQPKNNAEYWCSKIERNAQRRIDVKNELLAGGWEILEFWECDVMSDPLSCASIAKRAIDDRRSK